MAQSGRNSEYPISVIADAFVNEAHNFVHLGENIRYVPMINNHARGFKLKRKPNHRLEFGFLSHNKLTYLTI